MAWNNRGLVKTFKTDTDLSAKKYFIVQLDANDDAILSGVGASIVPLGVLTEDVASGAVTAAYVGVCLNGITEVSAGGGFRAGEYVASDASGEAVQASSGDYILGMAMEDALTGDIVAVDLTSKGSQLN